METQISKPNIFMPVIEALPRSQVLVFNEIQFPVRQIKQQRNMAYRVYRSSEKTDFVEVEGTAAYDVLAKCGVDKPLRIVRANTEVSTILKIDELDVPAVEAVAQAPAEAEAVQPPSAADTAPEEPAVPAPAAE